MPEITEIDEKEESIENEENINSEIRGENDNVEGRSEAVRSELDSHGANYAIIEIDKMEGKVCSFSGYETKFTPFQVGPTSDLVPLLPLSCLLCASSRR